jgi:hypothetical protein
MRLATTSLMRSIILCCISTIQWYIWQAVKSKALTPQYARLLTPQYARLLTGAHAMPASSHHTVASHTVYDSRQQLLYMLTADRSVAYCICATNSTQPRILYILDIAAHSSVAYCMCYYSSLAYSIYSRQEPRILYMLLWYSYIFFFCNS